MSTTWYPEGYSYPMMHPSGGSSSNSSASDRSRRAPLTTRYGVVRPPPSHAQPGILNHTPDLVDGIDYFKIGEPVRIRRYHTKKDEYSLWLTGKVERPILLSDGNGGTRRSYVVSYTDAYTGEVKEKTFSPFLNEISSLQPEISTVVYPKRAIVYAYIPVMRPDGSVSTSKIWTPATLLTPPNEHGARIRILAGPAVNREIANIKIIKPYSPQSAAECRYQGQAVEGDGTQLY